MIAFLLNRETVTSDLPAGTVTLDFLRHHRGLSGTKEGCREGDCGACLVLLGEPRNDGVFYRPVNSCLLPLGDVAGRHLVTIEGLNGDADTRRDLVKLLNAHPRVQCVAVCESAEVALERIPECRPQVILMDINLPGMSGIRCTARLKQLLPKTHILMLTAFSDDGSILEAVQAGASGYLLKSIPSTEVIGSILDVVDGGAPMTGKIARRVLEVFRQTAPKGPAEAQLTTREYETHD
jgi:DNA-binding NarL/FixJ family response regulator